MPVAEKHAQLPLAFVDQRAGEITSTILAYLQRCGYAVWRQNTSGIYDQETGKWRRNPQTRRGVPDIIGFHKASGRFIGVEVKYGSDRLRPEQRDFLNELKAAGGLAFVAYSFAEFQEEFERRGLHLPGRTTPINEPR